MPEYLEQGARSDDEGEGEGLTLGLGAFEKISTLEGVRLTPEMKRDLHALERQCVTAEEGTRFINRKYGRKFA